MKKTYLIAALAALGIAGGAYTVMHLMNDVHQEMTVQATAGSLSIGNATARFLIAGRPGAIFLTIENRGSADKLVAASSPLSQRLELHSHTMDNGVMKMRPVEKIDVPANAMTMLKSGGYHIMVFDVNKLPEKGSTVPLTLSFEKAGEVKVKAIVGEPGDKHGH